MVDRNVQAATARLRKTFRYPGDGDDGSDDGTPEVMDEQEQETYIAALAAQNRQRNAQFRQLLLALPLLASVPYALHLFLSSSSSPSKDRPSPALFSLLALTSLASTVFLVYRLPPSVTGVRFLDDLAPSSHSRGGKMGAGIGAGERSPLERVLPWLNAGLCGVVGVMGVLGAGMGLGWLPAVVYGVVLVAKVVMAGVDPEGELSALRYGFKGA
ncbi:hypothetical protein B0T19DRAFT_432337 [Cercophora scortea]|uniref:Uncharacterized protein n=1 Tax=Cercophora scortea TaxID=314031 RepID=A0AAE0M753_9PEZI|nr:hypothetical protein B0T19DRAFT_432337 [Cercophora scortea]